MFNIFINDKLLFINSLAMGGLFLGLCGLLGWIWKNKYQPERHYPIIKTVTIVLALLLFIAMVFCSIPDHDEVEHVNASWQMSQGLLPFNDFFQHHSPMLWIIATPLFKLSLISKYPVEIFRLISAGVDIFVFAIMCFMVKLLWRDSKAAWIALLFFMGNFLSIELYDFRPDLVANLCILSAFYLILRNRTMIAYGLSGILLGFAFSLSIKYLPFILIVPLLMFIRYRDFSFYWRALLIQVLGMFIGILPLLAWLEIHGLFQAFLKWVMFFNTGSSGILRPLIGGHFQLILTGFALAGCYRLLTSKNDQAVYQGQVLSMMLGLSVLEYFLKFQWDYYQQIFTLTAIIAASGPFMIFLRKLFNENRTVVAFLLMGIVLWNDIHSTQYRLRNGDYRKGKEIIETLRKFAGNDEVICIAPDHPITSRNAVYISTGWQYRSFLSHPDCREKLNNLVEKIKTRKPAVIIQKIICWTNDQGFVDHLLNKKILTPGEAETLRDYLSQNYRLVAIQDEEYWIRNDRFK